MEKWKQIPLFKRYEASTLGRLRSLNYKRTGKIKVLKPAYDNRGYLKTMLQGDNGKYKTWYVHSFVATTYHGKKNGLTVDHINGIKDDNRPENLEYVTASENVRRAFKQGKYKPMVGSKNGMAKLTEKDVKEIREHAANSGRYYGRKKLADKYNVSECTIKEVVTRRKNKFYNV